MTEYRCVLNIYDGDTLIAQSTAMMPPALEGDREQVFEMGLTHVHKEPEHTVHLAAVAEITRMVLD